MPHSNYEEISKVFIKHLYCKGKLSMSDLLIRLANQGIEVNGSSSPTDCQEWAHLSIGVEHLFEFHSGLMKHFGGTIAQIEPIMEGLSTPQLKALQLWELKKMPEPDGAPQPSWMFTNCSSSNTVWQSLYEIPFRFSKGCRKKYPSNINHLHHLDW